MKKLLLTLLLAMISWADEQADSAMRQHIDLLRNISTREQADAAADKISHFVPPENATAGLYDAMAAEYEKLYSSYYYGSARLAQALEADAEDAVLPAPPTRDVLAELEERMRRSFAALSPGMIPRQQMMIRILAIDLLNTLALICYDAFFHPVSRGSKYFSIPGRGYSRLQIPICRTHLPGPCYPLATNTGTASKSSSVPSQ